MYYTLTPPIKTLIQIWKQEKYMIILRIGGKKHDSEYSILKKDIYGQYFACLWKTTIGWMGVQGLLQGKNSWKGHPL